MAPAEGVSGRSRSRVGQDRQDEALRIPEGVAVVAGAGQALGGDRTLLGAGAGLQGVEEREPDGRLQLEVTVQFDVGRLPELVEVGALVSEQTVPSPVAGGGECRDDLVTVFILPPSTRDLEKRLKTRAQDLPEVVASRMAKAADEMSHYAEYDYTIINRDIATSLMELKSILTAERLKRERQIGLSNFVKALREGR